MDVLAQCSSLKNDFGASHGTNAPTSFKVELWIGDPLAGGAEVATTTTITDEDTGAVSTVANGYASVTITNNGTWFPAPDPTTGVLTTPVIDTFPASTGAYPAPITHFVLRDPATSAIWHSAAFLDGQQITVSTSGVVPRPRLAIFYNPVSGD